MDELAKIFQSMGLERSQLYCISPVKHTTNQLSKIVSDQKENKCNDVPATLTLDHILQSFAFKSSGKIFENRALNNLMFSKLSTLVLLQQNNLIYTSSCYMNNCAK